MEQRKLDLTLLLFSLIPDLIKLSEYIQQKIEKQAQGNLEKYFVFLYRLFMDSEVAFSVKESSLPMKDYKRPKFQKTPEEV